MNKIFLVMRQELYTAFRRKTYLLFAFALPVLSVVVLGAIQLIQDRSTETAGPQTQEQLDTELKLEGYIDESGLIKTIPEGLPQDRLSQYPSEAAAVAALDEGIIGGYYLIPGDYVETGEIFHVLPNDGSFIDDDQNWVIQRALTANLLGGDTLLAGHFLAPIRDVELTNVSPPSTGDEVAAGDCSRPGEACESNELVQFIPSFLVIIFYIAIISSSSMLFNSVTKEKENRTIEILMVSLSPRQLLAGKTLALGTAGLLQTLVWMLCIFAAFNLGGSTLNLPSEFNFPAYILVWSLVFFLGGFGLYASLMAGAGALVPRMKEAGLASFVVMIPLLIGYMVGLLAPMANASNNILLILMSFFPLTSPVVMIMRLTDGIVPLWQLLLSAGLLYVGAYLAFRSVAAMFHAQNLLSGQSYSIKRYLLALAGRAPI